MPKRKSKAAQPNNQRRKKKAAKRRPRLGTVVLFWPFLLFQWFTARLPGGARWPLRILGHPAILAAYLILPASAFYYARARAFDMGGVEQMPERTIVLDRRGEELGRIHGEKRDIIDYSKIDQDFIFAILAREDERFFKHDGVDWIGFGRAALRNIRDASLTQGASTLTMQLARNSYDLHAGWLGFSEVIQELDRKCLEIGVSKRIEANYNKEEILQHYVNRIFWGHTILGIEEAARTYFEKNANELTLSEAALLAGIVRGPNAFSPFRDFSHALRERDTTLERMVDAEFITREEADAAKAEEIHLRPENRRVFHGSWAMDLVRRELEDVLEEEEEDFGGFQVTTTFDHLVQEKAEEALNQHLRKFERSSGYPHQTRAEWQELPEPRPAPEYLQGAVVIIENLTGSVIASVGGRSADESRYNRAVQASRQVGSTFKPFVYLAAFEKGLSPDAMISDNPLRPGEIRGAGNWSPRNSDGEFHGVKPVSYGLIRSRNTMSVRVGNYAGLDYLAEIADRVGFDKPLRKDPASYLGTIDASPEEVASAYTVFPNGGERFPPRVIAEIRDRDGNVKYSNPNVSGYGLSYQAVRPNSARTTARILREVNERGTGASVRRLGFTKPSAGKTGTTDDYKDAWYAGFTSSLTGAVWVGFDNPKTTINRGYGSVLALPVWAEVMKTAERLGYAAEGIESKRSFAQVRLCHESEKRATKGCEAAGTAITESMPDADVPAADAFCTQHEGSPSVPGGDPPKAAPVDAEPEEVPRAERLESDVPRAEPVEPETPRAERVEDPVPRALPVD